MIVVWYAIGFVVAVVYVASALPRRAGEREDLSPDRERGD